jgi:hypothetical protein
MRCLDEHRETPWVPVLWQRATNDLVSVPGGRVRRFRKPAGQHARSAREQLPDPAHGSTGDARAVPSSHASLGPTRESSDITVPTSIRCIELPLLRSRSQPGLTPTSATPYSLCHSRRGHSIATGCPWSPPEHLLGHPLRPSISAPPHAGEGHGIAPGLGDPSNPASFSSRDGLGPASLKVGDESSPK